MQSHYRPIKHRLFSLAELDLQMFEIGVSHSTSSLLSGPNILSMTCELYSQERPVQLSPVVPLGAYKEGLLCDIQREEANVA